MNTHEEQHLRLIFMQNILYFFHQTIAQTLRGIYLKDISLKGIEGNDSSVLFFMNVLLFYYKENLIK